MTQKSLRDSLYLTDNIEETTFKYDEQLPSLPVPDVPQSIEKLLDTIKPIASDGSVFIETQKKALEFVKDKDVKELQELLKMRAAKNKNWLESWWLEFAYLRSRKPLIPYSNMAAPFPIKPYWPKASPGSAGYENVRIRRAALSTFFQLCFWRMLREEKMRPMIHKGVPWSMSQFKYLFNTSRRPGEPKDELFSCFKLAKEGSPESVEIIVLHKGHIFAIKPVTMRSPTNACILSAPLIEKQLKFIQDWANERAPGPGVGCLTTSERGDWFEAREKLSKVCENNKKLLERIEKALWVLVLDENEPDNQNNILSLSMCGDPNNRWADKSISSLAFKNGTFGANADHTPYDGFCTAILTHYLMTSLEECNGTWDEEMSAHANCTFAEYYEPELFNFELDVEVKNLIQEAQLHFHRVASTIDSLHSTFKQFGKAILKEYRFHPEAFIQVAIHAAYFSQHNKMAPAYVTASTRRFYNGRTETCRSCYPEMKEFAEFLTKHKTSRAKEAYELLGGAVHKFQTLMNEASNGNGCDRHLLGLYLTAILEGKKIPELFDDELVQKTNNYILSTSCGGYWDVSGGVPPLVEEGYGCFYGIEDDQITFCCTAYKTCPETDLRKFYENLERTLIDMQKILLSAKL